MSSYLWPHELWHARLACFSLSSRFFTILTSIELVMPSHHLIICHPLLFPSILPSIRVFSNELALCIRGHSIGASASVLPISSCDLLKHFNSLIVKLFQISVMPWAVAHQAPLSMRFSRQEYWSRLLFPSWPRDWTWVSHIANVCMLENYIPLFNLNMLLQIYKILIYENKCLPSLWTCQSVFPRGYYAWKLENIWRFYLFFKIVKL